MVNDNDFMDLLGTKSYFTWIFWINESEQQTVVYRSLKKNIIRITKGTNPVYGSNGSSMGPGRGLRLPLAERITFIPFRSLFFKRKCPFRQEKGSDEPLTGPSAPVNWICANLSFLQAK